MFLYNHELAQERAARAEALRIASESLARQEEERRAHLEAKPAAEPAEVPAARARAEVDSEKRRRRQRRTGLTRWR